jgi:hypothetical protein
MDILIGNFNPSVAAPSSGPQSTSNFTLGDDITSNIEERLQAVSKIPALDCMTCFPYFPEGKTGHFFSK